MPTLAPGNKRRHGGPSKHSSGGPIQQAGFTLIELLVVVTLVAIVSAVISLSLRDPAAAQLEREGERLAALFEAARAESRAAGIAVQWTPLQGDASGDQFRFLGLPPGVSLPTHWLAGTVAVQMPGPALVRLGPEPMIGAQSLVLSLGSEQLTLSTDGLAPFAISPVSSTQ